MKASLLFFISVILMACTGTKVTEEASQLNESTAISKSKNQDDRSPFDNELYKLIDTTKIYRLVASYYKYDENKTNAVASYDLKKYLKFYGNGRLAVFDDFNLNTLDTLTARATDQGHYEYKFNTLYTKNYLTNKSGEQFYNPQWHEMRGDTLSLYSQSTKNISHYLAVEIPKTVFVDNADW